jgi:hypothetical protein
VRANVPQPCLLYTFLGRVSSVAGRELERVLAAMVSGDGNVKFFPSAEEWLPLADPDCAIKTTDLWKNHFAAWAGPAIEKAHGAATDGFQPVAEQFTRERRVMLQRERANHIEWLSKRAAEITGTGGKPAAVQGSLYDDEAQSPVTPAPDWHSFTDPARRLTAFHADRAQTPKDRIEAEGVLRIYEKRIGHLDRLADLRPPEVITLGVLMLVPEQGVRRGV